VLSKVTIYVAIGSSLCSSSMSVLMSSVSLIGILTNRYFMSIVIILWLSFIFSFVRLFASVAIVL
jgi:hypothetical protein